MASKYTDKYKLPLPQDSDIIDAKDISDGFQIVENVMKEGIPLPDLRDDGFIYLKGVNTNRRWLPKVGVDYYTPEEKQEILDYAEEKAAELKTNAIAEIEKIRVEAEGNLRTATEEITAARTSAESAQTKAESAETAAKSAQSAAESAKAAATNAQTGANAAKDAAQTAANAAEESKTAAKQSASDASSSKTGADEAKTAAEKARDIAVEAANNAVAQSNVPLIANSLNETETGKTLDATQGKVLDDKKLDKAIWDERFGENPIITHTLPATSAALQSENEWKTYIENQYTSLPNGYTFFKVTIPQKHFFNPGTESRFLYCEAYKSSNTSGAIKYLSPWYFEESRREASGWNHRNFVQAEANKRLMTDAEGEKLAGLANYVMPETLPISKIEGLQNALDNAGTKKVATKESDGLQSAADKKKLDGIDDGATKTEISDALNSMTGTKALSDKQGALLKLEIGEKTTAPSVEATSLWSGLEEITEDVNKPYIGTCTHSTWLKDLKVSIENGDFKKGLTYFNLRSSEDSAMFVTFGFIMQDDSSRVIFAQSYQPKMGKYYYPDFQYQHEIDGKWQQWYGTTFNMASSNFNKSHQLLKDVEGLKKDVEGLKKDVAQILRG